MNQDTDKKMAGSDSLGRRWWILILAHATILFDCYMFAWPMAFVMWKNPLHIIVYFIAFLLLVFADVAYLETRKKEGLYIAGIIALYLHFILIFTSDAVGEHGTLFSVPFQITVAVQLIMLEFRV